MLRRLFLPVGLILALAGGLILPGPGRFLYRLDLIEWLVALIFLVSGLQSSAPLSLDGQNRAATCAAILLSLVAAPLIGMLLAHLLRLPPDVGLGLLVMAAVPPTLSSGVVMTTISGGSTTLALILTVTLNLAGILTLPMMLGITLGLSDAVPVDRIGLLLTMTRLVLLPYGAGRILRRIKPLHLGPACGYITSTCVIAVVFMAVAASRDDFFPFDRTILSAIGAALLFHLLLLLLAATTASLLSLPAKRRKAMVFVCAQKTLPLALATLTALDTTAAQAAVFCLLLHFLQLIIDSFLAGHWKT